MTGAGPRVGFLHTAEVHVATFTELVHAAAPQADTTHVVDASLLDDARAEGGLDDALTDRLRGRLREAAADSDVIVCTCSTLAGAAEALGPIDGVPVVRVDRPLARLAVASGPRVAVVVALASTLGPTTELLAEEAAAAGVDVELTEVICADAWARFEAGDVDGYLDVVAATAAGLEGECDVVMLAQASMAGAVDRIDLSVPVLAGPALAVAEALRITADRT